VLADAEAVAGLVSSGIAASCGSLGSASALALELASALAAAETVALGVTEADATSAVPTAVFFLVLRKLVSSQMNAQSAAVLNTTTASATRRSTFAFATRTSAGLESTFRARSSTPAPVGAAAAAPLARGSGATGVGVGVAPGTRPGAPAMGLVTAWRFSAWCAARASSYEYGRCCVAA
jgi:hypothetical protein